MPRPASNRVDADQASREEEVSLFDSRFAKLAAATLIAVGLVLLAPLWVITARVAFGHAPLAKFSELIAIQLIVAGVVFALGALYVALLEFRSRTRAAELTADGDESGTRGLGSDALQALPEILKAFGELKAVASLLVIAALMFVSATVLAWRGLDG
jgi:hypothetical protein